MRTSYCERVVYLITDTDMVRAHEIRIPYDGPWEEAKDLLGESVKAGQDQLTFDEQLQQIFQDQYASQKATIAYLTTQLRAAVDAGGVGIPKASLTSMRTEATDVNAQQFQNAQDALQNKITQMSGGSKLTGVSGAAIQSEAALNSAEAQAQSYAQEAITSQDTQLKNENYWRAIGALTGTTGLQNPLGYANAATSGTNAISGALGAQNSSNQGDTIGTVGSIFGGMLAGGFI